MQQDRNPLEEYRATVRLLVERHTVAVDGHGGELLGFRTEQALLIKLAAAVASNLGASHGAGAAGHERTPINVGAADLLGMITNTLHAQQRRLTEDDSRPRADVSLLRVQLALSNGFFAGRISAGRLDTETQRLQGWVRQIRDLLDPPHRFTLSKPCPLCNALLVDVTDQHGHTTRDLALLVVERHQAADSSISCRGCGQAWHGVLAARRLNMALDQAAADRADTGPIDLARSA